MSSSSNWRLASPADWNPTFLQKFQPLSGHLVSGRCQNQQGRERRVKNLGSTLSLSNQTHSSGTRKTTGQADLCSSRSRGRSHANDSGHRLGIETSGNQEKMRSTPWKRIGKGRWRAKKLMGTQQKVLPLHSSTRWRILKMGTTMTKTQTCAIDLNSFSELTVCSNSHQSWANQRVDHDVEQLQQLYSTQSWQSFGVKTTEAISTTMRDANWSLPSLCQAPEADVAGRCASQQIAVELPVGENQLTTRPTSVCVENYHHRLCPQGQGSVDQGTFFLGCTYARFYGMWSSQGALYTWWRLLSQSLSWCSLWATRHGHKRARNV